MGLCLWSSICHTYAIAHRLHDSITEVSQHFLLHGINDAPDMESRHVLLGRGSHRWLPISFLLLSYSNTYLQTTKAAIRKGPSSAGGGNNLPVFVHTGHTQPKTGWTRDCYHYYTYHRYPTYT